MKFNLVKFFLVFTVTWVTAFTVTSYAQEDDGCSFNFKEFQSHLNVDHYTVKSKTEVKKNEKTKTLSQSVVLENGTEIEFKGGGCAHFAYSFTFRGFKAQFKTTQDLLYLALSLLTETPTIKPDAYLLSTLTINNVSKVVQERKNRYKLACADATCYLDATEKGKLVLSYDFAL